MSVFVELCLGSHEILHGFDQKNDEVLQRVEAEFTRKLVARDRILSATENRVLISYAHDRVIYWAYEGSLDDLLHKLS
jgi:hypothetical protein